MHNKYIYIFIMFAVTYLIRVLPLTLIRKKIENIYIRSFLYYVPYVTLSLMTFPAIIDATSSPMAGAIALILGIVAAYKGLSLLNISLVCCISVFILELFLV